MQVGAQWEPDFTTSWALPARTAHEHCTSNTQQEKTGRERHCFLSWCCLEIPVAGNLPLANEASIGAGIRVDRPPKRWCLGQKITLLSPQLSHPHGFCASAFQQLYLILKNKTI